MKRFLPFIFPLVAVLVIVFLVFRWYRLNTQTPGEISEFGEGVEIENLSQNETREALAGVGDYQTVDMEATNPEDMGQVRYEIKDGKVRFSVMANLPQVETATYQVWLREPGSSVSRQAFELVEGKGGYLGSAAISAQVLPFEVVVSRETRPDDQIESILLKGLVQE